MKNVKKLFALLLTVVMVLSLSVTAFAASDGTIRIENATPNQTYSAYKIFDLTYSGDNVAYSYTDKGSEGSTDNFLTALKRTDSPFALIETVKEGLYNVSLKNNPSTGSPYSAAYISSWLTSNTNSLGNATAAETASANTVEFTNLPYGYYYITSSLGTTVTLNSAKKDVTVIDKNQIPTWDNDPDPSDDDPAPGKVIVNADGSKTTINSANYGESVTFDIGVNATDYVGTEQVTYYYISDTISDGFTLDLDNGAFKPIVKVGEETLTADQDYTVSVDGNSFEIIVNWAKISRDEDGKITSIQSKYPANTELHVRYTATVNADGEDVVIAGNGNPNTANFTWNTNKVGDEPEDPNNPNDPPETPSEPYNTQKQKTTTTYVYALGVKKVDPEGNVLKGAQFSVAGIQASGSNGVYIYTGATAEGGTDTVIDTDENGVLLIKGLKAGNYALKEETSPLGYNPLTEPVNIKAEIERTDTYTETITTYYDEDGNVVNTAVQGGTSTTITVAEKVVPLVVVNRAGTELPSTGGIGTTIFYILGGLLVVGAGVVLVTRKRMRAKG